MSPQRQNGAVAASLTHLHYALIGLRNAWMKIRFPPTSATDDQVVEVVDRLRRDGWAVMPNYLSAASCKAIAEGIDGLVAARNPALQEEYAGAEHRIFGAESVLPAVSEFNANPFLLAVAERYMGTQIVNVCTMANKSLPVSREEHTVGRWHRDSFGRQIKVIAYVVDVDETNGPFEHLPGSNRLSRITRDIGTAGLNAFQWRLSDDEVERVRQGDAGEARTFLGAAGSIIFIDTSVIHRARPVLKSARYAVTNYYVERARYRKELCDAYGVPFRA